jgi:hypothetical protein
MFFVLSYVNDIQQNKKYDDDMNGDWKEETGGRRFHLDVSLLGLMQAM